MFCPKCELRIPYNKAPQVDECTMCGGRFQISTRDVLEHGKFGLAQEIRPTQVALSEDIEKLFLSSGGKALLEGGTGIGKSLAYILPLVLQGQGKRAIIATAKKNLQDQLITKDIPLVLRKIMGKDVNVSKIAVAYKGKANYACWRMKAAIPVQFQKQYSEFIRGCRANSTPADIAHWDGDAPYWWSNVAIEHCSLGADCSDCADCKPQPQLASIVITNHHLVAFNAMLGGRLLGDYDYLILDEAHQLSESFRAAYEMKATIRGVTRIVATFNNATPLVDAIEATGRTTATIVTEKLQELVTSFKALHSAAEKNSAPDGSVDPTKIADEASTALIIADRIKANLASLMARITQARHRVINGETFGDSLSPEELLAALHAGRKLSSLVKGVKALSHSIATLGSPTIPGNSGPPPSPNTLISATRTDLRARPIEVGSIIRRELTAKYQVYLSATLSLGRRFTHAQKEFGITPSDEKCYTERIYQSPFPYDAKQALLYIPRHLPLPAHAGNPEDREVWVREVAREISRLVRLTNGNTFVLCTARKDMDEIVEAIPSTFWENSNLHLAVQGKNAAATLQEYLSYPGGVLFGLKSFWEGVDVPGDKLRMVIVPKLPFPHFMDPILNALKARVEAEGGRAFSTIQIPLMTFDMKQGLGRLIRTKSDKGIACILDPRVWTSKSQKKDHDPIITKIQNSTAKIIRPRYGYGQNLIGELPFRCTTHDYDIVRKAAKAYFK